MKKAVVIGAGIGGIAAGLRLRAKGYDVEVIEANDYPGGKMHVYHQGGFQWDAGPSLFTMPNLVDDLFRLFDLDPNKYFSYNKKETLCHYFWEDGTRFSAVADREEFISQTSKTFNISTQIIADYLKRNKEKYELTASTFLEKSLHKWKTWLSKDVLASLLQIHKLHMSSTLSEVNEKYFSDNSKLVQLFNRYATYNGSSPYQTPGIMSLIPHLEMHYGTFYPKGGMHAIVDSLVNLSIEKGIRFKLGTLVNRILHSNNKVTGVMTSKGQIDADLIISNADVFGTYHHLLKDVPRPERVLKQERSSSAMIFYWGMNRKFPTLDLHNIFFSSEYKEEFAAIFKHGTLYNDPTVYINITSKEEENHAPKGCENWFVMINTPGNMGQDWGKLRLKARDSIIAKLSRILNVDVAASIKEEIVLDPAGIEARTRSHQGALYGASSNSKFAAFIRHPNFSSQIKNLYFCGGSVHPGGGIPLCLLSAKIATDFVEST